MIVSADSRQEAPYSELLDKSKINIISSPSVWNKICEPYFSVAE